MRGMTQYWFNELELPNGGCLGLGCCPGYRLTPLAVIRQPGSLSGSYSYYQDMPRIDLVLLNRKDLASVGAPVKVLADDLAALGVEWLHLPIPNLRPPDEKFEIAWVDLWPRLDKEFQQGGRVFIDCYAGLGRTGTVASLILMQYGVSARNAIQAVRAVRPGSIETVGQVARMLHRATTSARERPSPTTSSRSRSKPV